MLLGTALLAALGFGLGIVAGLVLEEPGLLLDYVTGKTRSAPLDATRSANEFAANEREKERVVAAAPPAAPAVVAAPHLEAAGVGAAPREFEAAANANETPNGDAGSDAVGATGKTPPQVAAAPPSASAPKPAAPAAIAADSRRDADTSAAEPLVPAAPPAGGGYSVQVGALADAAGAEQLAVKLRKRGFPVYVAPSAEPGSKRWRVRVGPVASRAQADELATTLAREKLPTWILAEGQR
jgi:cell division septation protein DedD